MLPEIIPTPCRYPKGPNIAARWPNGFEITYWDLWFMITLKEGFRNDLDLFDKFLHEKLTPEARASRSEDWFRKLCHWRDLKKRIPDSQKALSLLASLPEKFLRKETKKGIERITSDYISDEFSDAMRNNPREQLRNHALTGSWSHFPVDPTPIALRYELEFQPPGERGYISAEQTFRLSDEIERAYDDEMKEVTTPAQRFAITRAFITLMIKHSDSWDDSYGRMNETFSRFYEDWLQSDLNAIGISEATFFSDLVWTHAFDDYCLCSANHRLLTSHLHALEQKTKELMLTAIEDLEKKLKTVFEWSRISDLKGVRRALEGITDRYAPYDDIE